MDRGLMISILGGLGAMLAWGLPLYFTKRSIDKVGYMTTLFWGQTLGVIPLLIYFLAKPDFSGFSISQTPEVLGLGIINALGFMLFYIAIGKGKVGIISTITASYSAFAVLISATLFKESIPPALILILGMVFLGIMLSSIEGFNFKGSIKGVWEAMLGVIFFAFWFPLWSNFIIGKNYLLLLILLRISMSLFLFLVSKIKKVDLRIKSFNLLIWLVIIGFLDATAYLALSWGYSLGSHPSIVSVLGATFSIPALILAWIFLKEKLKLNQFVGIVLIISGLVLLSIK